MIIEIWSDIVCPFCYIGKRRIEKALKKHPKGSQVKIEWKSFLLNPTLVTNPNQSIVEYLSATKGWTIEQAKQMTKQVTDMAAEEDLDYRMDKTVVANSKDAHRLLQYAKTVNQGNEMKERLFKAYFIEGKNIADFETLTSLGTDIGLEAELIEKVLHSNQFEENMLQDIYESHQLDVRGVPFFVLDNRFGISGAQHHDVFDETLHKAWVNFEAKQAV